MAQDSHTKRTQRHRKAAARKAHQTNRQQLREVSVRGLNAHFTVLALLTAAKTPVTLSAENAATVLRDFQHLRWQTERREDGSLTMSLVDSLPAPVVDVE